MTRNLGLIAKKEIKDSLTARWFWLYSLVFGGAVVVLFLTGITESRVMGFVGISRLLLTYFQLCVVILPIFILITTVRSIAGDRESNVLEYALSMPVSLRDFFWGKLTGRLLIITVPIIGAMAAALLWALIKGLFLDWNVIITYCLLLFSMAWCFLGMGILISSLSYRQETGVGIAFFIWLMLVLFLDIVLIGVFLQYQMNPELIISVAVLNPLQDFRIASMALFDPELTMLGPSSWFLLKTFGRTGFILFGILYPLIAGLFMSFIGYVVFTKRDIL